MIETLKELSAALERKKGGMAIIQQQIVDQKAIIKKYTEKIGDSEEAQIIIQTVARNTQKQLEYRVSELVTLGLSSVFDDPWELNLDFVIRRGRTECDLLWKKSDGRQSKRLSYGGAGGEEDVAALGLQFAMWSLQRPRTRAFMMLDEPLAALKGGDLPERGAMTIKEISSGIKLQILLISHSPDLIEGADRIFEFSMKNKITQVVQKQ